jgi:hypothetical protein
MYQVTKARGGVDVYLYSFFNLGARWRLVVNATLPPRKRSGTNCIGGWVGLRDGLDRCGKSRPPPGFNRRIVQPVASRYTEIQLNNSEYN